MEGGRKPPAQKGASAGGRRLSEVRLVPSAARVSRRRLVGPEEPHSWSQTDAPRTSPRSPGFGLIVAVTSRTWVEAVHGSGPQKSKAGDTSF